MNLSQNQYFELSRKNDKLLRGGDPLGSCHRKFKEKRQLFLVLGKIRALNELRFKMCWPSGSEASHLHFSTTFSMPSGLVA